MSKTNGSADALEYPLLKGWHEGQGSSYFCNMAKKFIPERYNDLEVIDITARGKGVVKSQQGKCLTRAIHVSFY